MQLNWGILSAARIADAIVRGVRLTTTNRIVAVAARDPERARAWAAERDIPRVFDSYTALLDSDDIEAVYIPLPNSLHREWSIRAMERGKHVLCEKPLTVTASEVDAMITARDRFGVKVMEAFMYRFHPQIDRAREMIAEGRLGEIKMIRASFDYTQRRSEDIRWVKELGGGAIYDVGSYCVNAATLFAGAAPSAVMASAHFTTGDVDETLAGVLEFPNGCFATIDCSFKEQYFQHVIVHGTEGMLTIPAPWHILTPQPPMLYTHGDSVEEVSVRAANSYAEMIECFAQCVLEDRPVPLPLETSRANMAVIEALLQSAREYRRAQIA